jgi:hypothetical protein
MKLRALGTTLLVICLAGAMFAPAGQAKKKKAGPVVVATDDTGDWGTNADPTISPLGGPMGQDLVEASITMADAQTINFILTVAELPPTGGWPEIGRYNWDITVDGDAFQMTGGFTEYLRGICNPNVTNSCPPPRDPGSAPFFIRQGPCTVGSACEEVALVHATFDAATGTITIPVTLDVFGAKVGSKIGPGASTYGASIYATVQANISQAALPNDLMVVPTTYKVPKVK